MSDKKYFPGSIVSSGDKENRRQIYRLLSILRCLSGSLVWITEWEILWGMAHIDSPGSKRN